MMHKWWFWFASSAVAAALLTGSTAAKEKQGPEPFSFPAVTAEQAALIEVPGYPEAPAVVLFRKGKFDIEVSPKFGLVTTVEVHSRLKVLKETGKSYGDVKIPHHPLAQLEVFDGQTVLPDGRVLPLPQSAVFRDKLNKSGSVAVLRAALPAVEVGAILDFHYRFRADSYFFLEPWLFQSEIPALYSEAEFTIPRAVKSRKFLDNPQKVSLREEVREIENGTRFRVWGENVPPRPDEPLSFAEIDLTTRVALVPEAYAMRGYVGVSEISWGKLSEIFKSIFLAAGKDDASAKRLARSLVATQKDAPKREQALTMFRYVRDQIVNVPSVSFGMSDNPDVDDVLKRKAGTPLEKALLLQTMLGTLEVPVEILLAASADTGTLSPEYPSLWQFERVLVAVDLEGNRQLGDPSDRCLALGQLPPSFEQASAMRTSNGQLIRFGASGAIANRRQAKLDLIVDGEGALAGKGTLSLSGHHATLGCSRVEGESDPNKRWQEWLERKYPAFTISGLTWSNEVDSKSFTLGWSMALREEEQLGDEVSVSPSQPFGPTRQPFTLTPEERKSAVVLPFADTDDLDLTLRWPESWSAELTPTAASSSSTVGGFTAATELLPDGHSLRYQRRFEVRKSRLHGSDDYRAIRDLYAQAEAHDAQAIVLRRD